MEIQALTVSDIVSSIKNILETEFSDITVVGEISNLSLSSAGHYYFTLSDENSSLSCALFKMDAFRNPAIRKIKNGDKVLLRGPISVYGKRGTFQLITKRIVPYGKGDLRAQFEFLKEKLKSQGYFDLEEKKEIPKLARRIAVITAINGAAVQDFINVIKRRTLWHDITIIPSIVQGDKCASSVIKGLDKVIAKGDYDVVVITRGGGSIEDLWGFNDEELVKRVFDLETPVISAIGHQTDYTLLDYVSDLRAETPSAAAEILSQEQTGLKTRLNYSSQKLRNSVLELKNLIEKRLNRINPERSLYLLKEKLYERKKALNDLRPDSRIDRLDIGNYYRDLDDSLLKMQTSLEMKKEQAAHRLGICNKLINSMNPNEVLGRGYTFLKSDDGVISSFADYERIPKEKQFLINFKDGTAYGKKVELKGKGK